MWNGFGDVATIEGKLSVLARNCADVRRDPREIVKTRLGTLIVAPTEEEAERRKSAWQASKGHEDGAVAPRLSWGSPETLGGRVRPFLEAGLDGSLFNMPTGSTREDVDLAGRALRASVG